MWDIANPSEPLVFHASRSFSGFYGKLTGSCYAETFSVEGCRWQTFLSLSESQGEERERERERERQRETERESERVREGASEGRREGGRNRQRERESERGLCDG